MSELVGSERFALEETLLFWRGLARTGLAKQELCREYPGFGRFKNYHAECALCEYTKEKTIYSANCYKCPVDWEVYPSECDMGEEEYWIPSNSSCRTGRCQHSSSPYRKWEKSTLKEERREAAQEVCSLLEHTIVNLYGNVEEKE